MLTYSKPSNSFYCMTNEELSTKSKSTDLSKFSPGLGYGQLFMSVYVSIFYNVVLAYCLYFFFASFTSRLPWIGCSNSWNTRLCSEIYDECIADGGIVTDDKNCTRLDDLAQYELTYYNVTIIPRNGTYNTSLYRDPFIHVRALPSQEYWK